MLQKIPIFLLLLLGRFFISQCSSYNLFPLHGAVFLPHDPRNASAAEQVGNQKLFNFNFCVKYLATMESVMPIIDIATVDAHQKYLQARF